MYYPRTTVVKRRRVKKYDIYINILLNFNLQLISLSLRVYTHVLTYSNNIHPTDLYLVFLNFFRILNKYLYIIIYIGI